MGLAGGWALSLVPHPSVCRLCIHPSICPSIRSSVACSKFELYTMEWSLKENLRDCLVAAAPYGGPIGKGWDPQDPTLGQEPPRHTGQGLSCTPGSDGRGATARTDCPIPPTALLKNNARKEKSPGVRPLLEIYSASGLLLASIPVSWPGVSHPLL